MEPPKKKSDRVEQTKLLRDAGYDVFYTLFKNEIAKIACTCNITKDGEIVASGISICSLTDEYKPRKGKNKAFYRALKAFNSKESSEPISPFSRRAWVSLNSFVKRKIDVTKLDPSYVNDLINNVSEIYRKNNQERYFKIKSYKEGEKEKISLKIPLNYCLLNIFEDYKYKSEYCSK